MESILLLVPFILGISYPRSGTLNTKPISMKKEKSKQLDDSMSDSLNLAVGVPL